MPASSVPQLDASKAPSREIWKVLVGQKALVTGANSGIGKATAIALGRAGADVVVNYVSGDEQADAVVDEIRRFGANAYAHKADVSQEEQVQQMFRRMLEEFETIDILVNNAGLQRDAAFHEMTLAQWNTVIGINLTGQFLCARAAVREFLRRQDHLHELGARGDPVGRARKLRGIERRRYAADEKPRPGACSSSHSRQQHRAGGHPNANQYRSLGDQRSV